MCEAIGEDFRFNPNYLRIALALGLFWNPVAVLGGYAAAGVLVTLSRWIQPNPRTAVEVAAPAAQPAAEPMPEAVAAEAGQLLAA